MSYENDQLEMDGPLFVQGAIYGAVAFVVGYLITLVVVATQEAEVLREDLIEVSGWFYYNAQFVDVEIGVGGNGLGGLVDDFSFNLVTGETFFGEPIQTGAPSILYHLIPIIVLLAAGFLLAKRVGAVNPQEGALAGATLAIGTAVLSVVGTFVFEFSEEGATAGPALVDSLLFVGILFPVILGAIGGALSTQT